MKGVTRSYLFGAGCHTGWGGGAFGPWGGLLFFGFGAFFVPAIDLASSRHGRRARPDCARSSTASPVPIPRHDGPPPAAALLEPGDLAHTLPSLCGDTTGRSGH